MLSSLVKYGVVFLKKVKAENPDVHAKGTHAHNFKVAFISIFFNVATDWYCVLNVFNHQVDIRELIVRVSTEHS